MKKPITVIKSTFEQREERRELEEDIKDNIREVIQSILIGTVDTHFVGDIDVTVRGSREGIVRKSSLTIRVENPVTYTRVNTIE